MNIINNMNKTDTEFEYQINKIELSNTPTIFKLHSCMYF